MEPSVVLSRDVLPYLPACAAMLAELGIPRLLPAVALSRTTSPAALPPAETAWFLPVHLWGLASIYHGWRLLFGDEFRGCFGVDLLALLSHAALSFSVLALIAPICVLAEQAARLRSLSARTACATLPLPVLATLLGVAGCWVVLLLASSPGSLGR
jgi:hypothetical protein